MGYLTSRFGALPAPGTPAEIEWVDRAYSHLLAECPVARATTYYVQQDANGSATGAISSVARDGLTIATAMGVRHTKDLNTLLASIVTAPNIAVLFRRGDIFCCDSADPTNSQVNLPAFANVTLGAYRGSANAGADDVGSLWRLPQFRGTLAPFSGSWTVSNTLGGAYAGYSANLFHRAVSQTVYHVLFSEDDQVDGAAFGFGTRTIRWYGRLGTGTSPTITAALTSMDAIDEDAAVYDTTNARLHVRSRSARTATFNTASRIEAVISNTRGISIPNITGWRIDSLAVNGWGMNSDVGVSQAYCIHGTHKDQNFGAVTNCVIGYSGHHAYGQLVTTDGDAGGTTLFSGNVCGFTQGDNSGNSTTAVAYAQAGLNEVLYVGERLVYGNLKSINLGTNSTGTGTTTAPRGVCDGWYAHAGASRPAPDLCILFRCTIDRAAMLDGGSNVALGGADGRGDGQTRPNAELVTSWNKSRLIQCRQPQGTLSAFSAKLDTAYVSCDIRATFPISGTIAVSLASSNHNMLFESTYLEWDVTNRATTSTTYLDIFTCNTGSSPFLGFVSSHVHIVQQPNQQVGVCNRFRTLDGFQTCIGINSVFTTSALPSVSGTDKSLVALPNRTPVVGGTGGMRGCAFYGFREVTRTTTPNTNESWGYSASASPTTLGAPLIYSAVPASTPHIDWMTAQVDIDGRPLAAPIVGPSPASTLPRVNTITGSSPPIL
jgi:hypothetical protein